ncbi:MAG: MFS transporter [Nanoarchaeota archaeon]
MVMQNLKSNINLYYIFSFIGSIQFYGPIFALFFQSFSLSQTQILSFLSIYAISTILFEIPTGIFSDYIGRKKTLLISSILLSLCFFIFAFGNNYWYFAVAYLIMGLSGAFSSGTDQSFLYDTLLNLKKENKFKKILGKSAFIENLAVIISMALGGLLFSINHKFPYLLTAIIASLNIFIVLFFKEPPRIKSNKSLLKHTLLSFKIFHKNKKLLMLSLFSVITISAVVISFFLIQQYYKFIGIPIALIGLVIVGSKIIESLSSKYAYVIEKKLKFKISIILIALFIVLGYGLMSFYSFYWVFIFAYLLNIALGFSGPVFSDYINKHISSDKRSTILSIKNQLRNIIFLLIPPLIGRVADKSLQLSFTVMAISAALLYMLIIYYLIKLNNKD